MNAPADSAPYVLERAFRDEAGRLTASLVRLLGDFDLAEELVADAVVEALEHNEGYLTTAGAMPIRRDLACDAEWLADLLCRLMPDEPEPLGLLALIRLHLARWPARLDAAGRLVLLQHQDRSTWDRTAISQAVALIERAARLRGPRCYQIEAMIAALHCEAPSWEATDWPQILALYSVLLQ